MTADKPRLSGFGEGRRSRLNALGAGYTFFVRGARILLPLVALVLVGIVISNLSRTPDLPKITDIPKTEQPTPGKVELVAARYQGKDAQGHAYALTADHAERSLTAPDVVEFTKPKADITLENGWLAAQAESGRYDAKNYLLVLEGGVSVFHDAGYSASLRDVRVNVDEQRAETAHPVELHGALGSLQAASLTVENRGDLVIFGGPLKLVVHTQALASSAPSIRKDMPEKGKKR